MKNPLYKRYKRELISNSGRYLAISLIFIVAVAIISAFLIVAGGIRTAVDENRSNYLMEDGLFTSQTEIYDYVLTEIEKINITIAQNYYTDTDIASGITLRVFKSRESINLATVMKGRLPVSINEIALDRLFAENNGFCIDDIINIRGKDMKIVGLVSLPDYSSLFKKNTDLMMDSFHFGVSVVNEETFGTFAENDIIYNYAYRYNGRNLTDKEKADLAAEIKSGLTARGVPLTNFLTAEENQSISFAEDDMSTDVPMVKVFLYIIIVIMAFVFVIVISSTIESESAVIGTLLASGYKRRELIRHYMTLPVIVTFAGALIGNVLSCTVMPQVFMNIYYGAYSLPPMEIKLNPEAIFLTAVLPIILMVIINWFSLNRKLRISPLNFLRKDLQRHKNKKVITLPDFSFISRFRIRVILQNKGSYITLFFGIMFAGFILMFGLSLSPAINHYIERIEAAAASDYQYILKYPVEIRDAENAEKFIIRTLEIYYLPADKDYEVSFYGVQNNGIYFHNLQFDSSTNQNSAVISDSLARKTGIKIGDTITFNDSYTNIDYAITVTGIYDYPSGLSAFMDIEQLNRMLGNNAGYFNGYFSNIKLEFDEKDLAAIIAPGDMSRLGDQMLSTFGQMAPIFLIASIVIYLVLMYILTKIVIDKNAVNISYMKVFGYKEREIRKLYLDATSITVIASLFFTLPPICVGIKYAFKFAFIKVNGYMEAYLPFYLFAAIVGIGIISYLIINFFHLRRVGKINLSEALKGKE